jgi:predicted DNA-binding protein
MKRIIQNDEQIVLRVPRELRERIERKAAAEDRSLAYMARRLLERAVAESEQEAAA